MIRFVSRQFYPLALILGFAAYGYYGDGLNDGFTTMNLATVYAQVSDAAPKFSDTFSQVPRL